MSISQNQGVPSVRELFDGIGSAYENAFAGIEPQIASIEWLKAQLSEVKPAKVLDIGSGTGKPLCSELAKAGHDVLGIDISGVMVSHAIQSVPQAKFANTSIDDYEPAPASFDAITAYLSLIADVSQDDIKRHFKKVYTLLRPGGYFVYANLALDCDNFESTWMGRPVIMSALDEKTTLNYFESIGFEILYTKVSEFKPRGVQAGICEAEDNKEETHLFVYARKPQT